MHHLKSIYIYIPIVTLMLQAKSHRSYQTPSKEQKK